MKINKVSQNKKRIHFFNITQKLKTFADEAKDGFIIFTLGSFVSVSSMPKELVDTFVRVMSQLPQRVFWKWEGDFPGSVSSNIMIVNGMLPQQDLLGSFL